MVVVNILHAYYVIDFFVNEDWFVTYTISQLWLR